VSVNPNELSMDHLAPAEEMKQEVIAQSAPSEAQPAPDLSDPRDKDEWTFQFDWTDARGVRWPGTFTNKILSMGETDGVAALFARFVAGQPWNAIIPDVRITAHAIAHMTFSLANEGRPPWATNLRAVKDPQLILALWGKVGSHEARYFRLEEASEGGASPAPTRVGTSGVVDPEVPTPSE
jgi:hypothetical protein